MKFTSTLCVIAIAITSFATADLTQYVNDLPSCGVPLNHYKVNAISSWRHLAKMHFGNIAKLCLWFDKPKLYMHKYQCFSSNKFVPYPKLYCDRKTS